MFTGPDGRLRCQWAAGAPEFIAYHDTEWGFPVDDDKMLFEKLCLEAFQAGLSWRTVLVKRPGFRAAFANFDFNAIGEFTETEINRLLQDSGIVRHRGKIEAVVNNAQRAIELVETHGSLAAYLWGYEPDPAEAPEPQSRSTSPESVALSRDLKKRGWRFVGPTTAFAFMQAMGLVNDHETGCAIRPESAARRNTFGQLDPTRPSDGHTRPRNTTPRAA